MAKIKLTKTIVDAAKPATVDIELRDTVVPGFLCKITPSGRKVFMVRYRTNAGERRKPSIGLFGELTVEQARVLAQDWLAEVRRGGDPSARKTAARKAPTVRELCVRFMEDYSKLHNKPRTQDTYQGQIDRHIVPILGGKKVHEVVRADIMMIMKRLEKHPVGANRVLACTSKMFNLAEMWGYRPDGSNPCRHVPKYPERGKTRLIANEEMTRSFTYLDKAEAEGLEHPTLTLAIRLQFEFAARISEVCQLRWDWIDFTNRRIVWPDSKTGDMSKPMNDVVYRLLETAQRFEECPYVCPAIFDSRLPLPYGTYYTAWKRILKRTGVPRVGTHGVRHRAATDIANSGVPVKVGMALTAHKTVTMFMRYVHAEDDPVRAAAELVASRRKAVVGSQESVPSGEIQSVVPYRPFRYRKGENQTTPLGSKRKAGGRPAEADA